jgi:hypothetical protein
MTRSETPSLRQIGSPAPILSDRFARLRPQGTLGGTMSTRFLQQVRQLAQGPEGRRLATEAKRLAKDPRTRARIDEARKRLSGGGAGRGKPA